MSLYTPEPPCNFFAFVVMLTAIAVGLAFCLYVNITGWTLP